MTRSFTALIRPLATGWGIASASALAGAGSASIEIFVGASLYNTVAHTAATGLGIALGYPLAVWTTRRYGDGLVALARFPTPMAPEHPAGPAPRSAVSGLYLLALALSATGALLAVPVGVLALVLFLTGIPVTADTVRWIAGWGGVALLAAVATLIGLAAARWHRAPRTWQSASAGAVRTAQEQVGGALSRFNAALGLTWRSSRPR